MILLDTDVCIEILRKNKIVIKKRELAEEDTAISFITVGEFYYGAEKSAYKNDNKKLIEEFLLTINVLQSDNDIMKKFGEIKADLKTNNILLPDADILIAATTLTKATKLITGNIKHFERINGLKIENWIG